MRRPKRALIDVDSLLDSVHSTRPSPSAPTHRHTEFVITASGLSAARSYHTPQLEASNPSLSRANDVDIDTSGLYMIEPEEPEPEEDGTTIRLISRRRTIGVCAE